LGWWHRREISFFRNGIKPEKPIKSHTVVIGKKTME
jgi:hypothetical protein